MVRILDGKVLQLCWLLCILTNERSKVFIHNQAIAVCWYTGQGVEVAVNLQVIAMSVTHR